MIRNILIVFTYPLIILHICINIVACQAHPALVKQIQCGPYF